MTDPRAALAAMLARVSPVGGETISLDVAAGRVLAESATSDRPSPACDVSAMDGYAVRLADLKNPRLPVAGESAIGQTPPAMPHARALSIFTGGPVPQGCDAVIPREQVTETPGYIELPDSLAVRTGQHIRRRGENGAEGTIVVTAGRCVDAPAAAALAAVGVASPRVFRRLRVTVIVTGDEVRQAADAVDPWQLRDSNGPAVRAMLGPLPWCDLRPIIHAPDDPQAIRFAVESALGSADAVVLTGGVSMGDHDHVPAAVVACGCEVVFHKLAIRPGKPMLAAIGPAGQVVIGLPGNPVSVMTTLRRLGLAILQARAGMTPRTGGDGWVKVIGEQRAPERLTWFPAVRIDADGTATLAAGRGSGDWVAAAGSVGFVEIPPGEPVAGWRELFRWGV